MRKENSAERYYRHELNALLIAMLFYDLIAAVIVFFRVLSADGSNAVIYGDAWFLLLTFGLFPLLCLPGLVYAFFRYRHYKSAELVNVQRVKLDQTDTVWRNLVGFRKPDGRIEKPDIKDRYEPDYFDEHKNPDWM